MKHKMHSATWILAIALVVSGGSVLGDDYIVEWWTTDGGGDMFSTGGDYELSGTVGQPDASPVMMTGGDFELSGGFWLPVAGGGVPTEPVADWRGVVDGVAEPIEDEPAP